MGNLVAYYKMNDTPGATLEDIAGGNNGTITGASFVESGAPQGDGSLFNYDGGPGNLNISTVSGGTYPLRIDFDETAGGVHAYLINGSPNQLAIDGFTDFTSGPYFGIFAPGASSTVRFGYTNDAAEADFRIV